MAHNRRRRRRSHKQGTKRWWKKAVSAVLLALLFLAFWRIEEDKNAGGPGLTLPWQKQETASPPGIAKEQGKPDDQSDGENPAGRTDEENPAGRTDGENPAGRTDGENPAGRTGEENSKEPADPGETGSSGIPDSGHADSFALDMVPPYSGRAYADINGDVPFFTEEEMTSEAFHEYWPLDGLGRCTGAYACVGPETLPTQPRGDISMVKPTGWNTNRYDDIDGEMLFNRCHLIGHLLTGQDANERNLITGTRYMNVEGMLPFEESVVMYVEGTGHHVMYRVRPYFDGDNLVCSGVLMEARSVEDPLVQFCAFCYNVQPGIEIDYATGENRRAEGQ